MILVLEAVVDFGIITARKILFCSKSGDWTFVILLKDAVGLLAIFLVAVA